MDGAGRKGERLACKGRAAERGESVVKFDLSSKAGLRNVIEGTTSSAEVAVAEGGTLPLEGRRAGISTTTSTSFFDSLRRFFSTSAFSAS